MAGSWVQRAVYSAVLANQQAVKWMWALSVSDPDCFWVICMSVCKEAGSSELADLTYLLAQGRVSPSSTLPCASK